jgi:hypothetical protein
MGNINWWQLLIDVLSALIPVLQQYAPSDAGSAQIQKQSDPS